MSQSKESRMRSVGILIRILRVETFCFRPFISQNELLKMRFCVLVKIKRKKIIGILELKIHC